MSAVEDYRHAAQFAWCQDRYMVPGPVYDALALADAAIAELQQTQDVRDATYEAWKHFREKWVQAEDRAEHAEATIERWGDDFGGYWVDRANEAEAELAALKEEYEAFKTHHRGGGCGCDATVREFVSIDGMVEP